MNMLPLSSCCARAVAPRPRAGCDPLAAPGYDVRVADAHLGAVCPSVAHVLRQHARDTNRHGQRAGWVVRDGHERAAVFDGDRVIDVGLPHGPCRPIGAVDTRAPRHLQASRARAINSWAQVVGRAATRDRVFGFMWSRQTGLLELSEHLDQNDVKAPLAWRIADALHIDDQGRILAVGVRDGRWHDVLLTPKPHDDDSFAIEHALETRLAHPDDPDDPHDPITC